MMAETQNMSRPHRSEAVTGIVVALLLAGYLVGTSTFDLIPDLGVYNAKRILQLALFVLIPAIVLLQPGLRYRFSEQLTRLPAVLQLVVLAVAILGVISAFSHGYPAYSLVEVVSMFLLAAMVLVVAACRSASGRIFDHVILVSLMLLGFAVALQEMMGVLVGWAMQSEFSYEQVLTYFAHPRFYNQLQTWFIPLLAAVPSVFARSRKARWACVIVLGLNWFLLIMTGARGSILSLVLSFTLIALIAPSRAASWFKWQAAGIVLGLVIFLGILALNQAMAPDGGQYVEESVGREMTNSTGRTGMWQISLNEAIANPWLGTGPMRYGCDWEATLPAHPHNLYLQVFSEWGVPAGLLLLIIAAWLAWRAVLHARATHTAPDTEDRPGILLLTLTCSMSAAAIHAGASGLFMTPASQVAAVLAGGWLLGHHSPHSKPTGKLPKESASRTAKALLVITLVSALSLSVFAFGELGHMGERVQYAPGYGPAMPRFWQDGRVCLYSE